jgi:hypothetical protein
MWTHKKPLRSRTKRIRRKRSRFITPDLSVCHGQLLHFVANKDSPLSAAERLGQEYAAMADDHEAAVRQFLQRAYFIVVQFWRRPYEFERLQVHPFSKQSGQKAGGPKTSKSVLCFLTQATTPNQRHLANKYAVILDGLMQDQVVVTGVAARIKKLGGIEAAYESMRRCDQSSSLQIGESLTPETTKRGRRRRPKCTFPLYPLVAPLLEQETPTYDDGEENNIVWGESIFGFVQRLARRYAEIEDGDHQAVSRVLQCAYLAVRDMQRDPDELARLQADPFLKPPWRRPKDPSTSKWLMYFIVQARSPEVRHLAGKYAEILDGLRQDQVEISEVAAAYQAMRARTTGHESCVTQDSQNKRTPAMALKSKQSAPPTTQTTKPTDGYGQFFDEGGYYIIGRSGEKIRFSRPKPPRPPRKLNHLGHLGINISRSKAQLQQARTKEERDYLNKKIRVLEQLLQEGQAKALARRLAARAKRRLGW